MTPSFRLTPRAADDLKAIADYTLSNWGPDQMARYIQALLDRIAWLADNPELGRRRPEFGTGLRSYREGSHLIFYRQRKGRTEVIAIPHQAMDLDAL